MNFEAKRKRNIPQSKLKKPGDFDPQSDFLRKEVNAFFLAGNCVKKIPRQEVRKTNPMKPKSQNNLQYWGVYVD